MHSRGECAKTSEESSPVGECLLIEQMLVYAGLRDEDRSHNSREVLPQEDLGSESRMIHVLGTYLDGNSMSQVRLACTVRTASCTE